MARLKFLKSDGRPTVLELEGSELTLGRHRGNEIAVDRYRHVSGEHARLKWHDSTSSYELIDLGSSNGTEVNGELISRIMLRDGDTILFGELVARYEQDEEPVELRPYAEAVKERDVLEREKVDLRCQLASVRAELEAAEKERDAVQAERDAAAAAGEAAVKERELAAEASLREQRESLKACEAKVAAARDVIGVLEEKAAGEKQRLQELVSEITRSRGALESVGEEIEAKGLELQKLEGYGKSLQAKIREGLEATKALERQRASAKERLRAAEQEIAWKRHRLVELDRVIAKREALLDDLETRSIRVPADGGSIEVPEPPPAPIEPPPVDLEEAEGSLEDELTRLGIRIHPASQKKG